MPIRQSWSSQSLMPKTRRLRPRVFWQTSRRPTRTMRRPRHGMRLRLRLTGSVPQRWTLNRLITRNSSRTLSASSRRSWSASVKKSVSARKRKKESAEKRKSASVRRKRNADVRKKSRSALRQKPTARSMSPKRLPILPRPNPFQALMTTAARTTLPVLLRALSGPAPLSLT